MHNRVIGSFFFCERTITANIYLDKLDLYVAPQLNDLQSLVIFQQDGVPPHLGLDVRKFLDDTFPDIWLAVEVRHHGRHGHLI